MKRNINIFLFAVLMAALYTGCQKEPAEVTQTTELKGVMAGAIKIAILSDIHYMDPSLLAETPSMPFEMYIFADPKLLWESQYIIPQALKQINAEKPDLLLIPGDLTKDGELICHEGIIDMLQKYLDPKIKILVVPGNHDINNPSAKKYYQTYTTPVPTITAADFKELYEEFGYGSAISHDASSLSYVSEPFKDFRVICIDACKYDPPGETSGAIAPETMEWIKDQLADAQGKNMQVVAMMHHNLMEHHPMQETIQPGFVLDDWSNVSTELMNAGLKVIFTGHYHAVDIVKHQDGMLFDIETGSPVSYPLPFRVLKYRNNDRIDIETKYVTGINIGEVPLQDYAFGFLQSHLNALFAYMISNPPYNAPEAAAEGAPLLTHGYMAHFCGDEMIPPGEQEAINAFIAKYSSGIGPFIGGVAMAFWTDLPIEDKNMTLNISTGSVPY